MDQQPAAVAAPTLRARATQALRRRHNWEQLAKFCVVGASGYVVNLAVYAVLLNWADWHYRLAATDSIAKAKCQMTKESQNPNSKGPTSGSQGDRLHSSG